MNICLLVVLGCSGVTKSGVCSAECVGWVCVWLVYFR